MSRFFVERPILANVVAKTAGILIEQAVNGVEGSIAMRSNSGSDGNYTLTLTFDVGTNLNTAIALVQNAVNSALSQMPEEVQTQGVEVARVDLGQQTFTTFPGLSGRKAAQINVYTLPGANALAVAREVRTAMTRMAETFPPGLEYTALLDTSAFIEDSIHGVYEALVEAGVLVLIVIMLFLQNPRAMLVPATTVPVTIIGAFAAMALLGFTVNLMTLFALILAIGIVVVDAIVIVENASRYIEQGMTPKDAAIKAMGELTGPILGITLVLVSVFLPASFLPGITGQMFRQFALVIAATAVISALNALTLKPAQCALYLQPQPAGRRVNWYYRGFNRAYQAVEDRYVGVVEWMVRRPWAMVGLFAGLVGAAGAGFAVYPATLLPLEDQGY